MPKRRKKVRKKRATTTEGKVAEAVELEEVTFDRWVDLYRKSIRAFDKWRAADRKLDRLMDRWADEQRFEQDPDWKTPCVNCTHWKWVHALPGSAVVASLSGPCSHKGCDCEHFTKTKGD